MNDAREHSVPTLETPRYQSRGLRSCGCRLPASTIAAVIAFGVVAGGLAEAASETDREQLVVTAGNALLDKLVGAWVLSGTMAGKHTIHDVTASRTLNGNYVRLDEIS